MKKKLISFLLFSIIICYLNSQEKKIESELKIFFENKDYKTEKYIIGTSNICFSYVNAINSSDIITKGIIYDDSSEFKVYLKIDYEKIYIGNTLSFEGIIKNQDFYGYKIFIKKKSVATAFYANMGESVADGPIFSWNDNNKEFKRYVIDPSQY